VLKYRSTTGLIMECAPTTLEKYVRDLGQALRGDLIVALGLQVVRALLHLFVHGVVHGDVKLDNFLVEQLLLPAPPSEVPKAKGAAPAPAGGGGGGGGGAAAVACPRVMLVDFGCAVMRGEGQADMNAQFEVHAAEATNFSLGNLAHRAPEVVAALARKGELRRGSEERVVVPLAGQDAFAAGVTLCVHLSVCVSHSLSQSLYLSLTRTRTPSLYLSPCPPLLSSRFSFFSLPVSTKRCGLDCTCFPLLG
jgi:serine/threonine protein kinase